MGGLQVLLLWKRLSRLFTLVVLFSSKKYSVNVSRMRRAKSYMSAEIIGQLMCLGVYRTECEATCENRYLVGRQNRIGEIYNRRVIKWKLSRLVLAARAFASAGESIRHGRVTG